MEGRKLIQIEVGMVIKTYTNGEDIAKTVKYIFKEDLGNVYRVTFPRPNNPEIKDIDLIPDSEIRKVWMDGKWMNYDEDE